MSFTNQIKRISIAIIIYIKTYFIMSCLKKAYSRIFEYPEMWNQTTKSNSSTSHKSVKLCIKCINMLKLTRLLTIRFNMRN